MATINPVLRQNSEYNVEGHNIGGQLMPMMGQHDIGLTGTWSAQGTPNAAEAQAAEQYMRSMQSQIAQAPSGNYIPDPKPGTKKEALTYTPPQALPVAQGQLDASRLKEEDVAETAGQGTLGQAALAGLKKIASSESYGDGAESTLTRNILNKFRETPAKKKGLGAGEEEVGFKIPEISEQALDDIGLQFGKQLGRNLRPLGPTQWLGGPGGTRQIGERTLPIDVEILKALTY